MKRCARALCGGWYLVFAVYCLFPAAPAAGADLDFLVTWSAMGVGNNTKASAVITIDDTLLLNPGRNDHALDPFIVDLTMTVVRSASGNGIFKLAAFDNVILDTDPLVVAGLPLDFSLELVGQATGVDPWGTSYASDAGDFNLFNYVSIPGIPEAVGVFRICTDGGAGECVELASFKPLDNASPSPEELRKCQDAIAKAGQKYASDRHKALSKCRDSLARRKALYQDKAKTAPLAGSHECAADYTTAKKLAKASAKARKQIEKCTDALVLQLGTCETTVDALISPDATTGCLLDSHANAVDDLLEAEYGF